MKTELKDIIHLYMGCRMKLDNGAYCDLTPSRLSLLQQTNKPERYKPILRPLSDLADDEAIEIAKMADDVLELCIRDEDPEIIRDKYTIQVCYKDIHAERGREDKRFIIWVKGKPWLTHQTPVCNFQYITAYLLKQGFDLFGLIESGQALNKTKI